MSVPATANPREIDSAFSPPARATAPPRLTERWPALFPVAVRVHRARRRIRWLTARSAWATARETTPLPHRVKRHKSLLLRQLGESEMWLQHNKITNLRLASARVNGILIRPGETFSFNKVVGNCTRRKGYVEGMKLSNGDAEAGVGGGICQLANLLHWMFLHSALTVVERSEHSFDPFPDKGRVLPWGVGCSIVYNYVDLVVRNDTDVTFQLLVTVGERHLRGELRSSAATAYTYSVFARDEQFWRYDGQVFRRNEIWRRVVSRTSGDAVREELLKHNCALVKYLPEAVAILDADLASSGQDQATTRPRRTTRAGSRRTLRSESGSRG
jgi:vancomycin resistance protein VanW